jgi:hypothetical protein
VVVLAGQGPPSLVGQHPIVPPMSGMHQHVGRVRFREVNVTQQGTEQPAPGTQETQPQTQQPAPTEPASQPAPQQPQQTPAPQPQQQPAQESRGNDDVLTALNALPERIVNAVREAVVPPKQTETPAPKQESQQQTQQTKTPGRKSFADWWFGS